MTDTTEPATACGHVRSFVQPNMTCTRHQDHEGTHRGNDGSTWGPIADPTTLAAGMTTTQVFRVFEAKLDEITTQLAELHELLAKIDDDQISNHLRCLGCLIEQHQGTRTGANPAAAVVGGQSTCLEHLQFADEPVLAGRTASVVILGNGS